MYSTTCLQCSEQSIQNKVSWSWFVIYFVCVNPKHLLLWHHYLNTFYHDWENNNKKQTFHCHLLAYIRLSFSPHHPRFVFYWIVSNVSISILIHYHTTITYQNAFLLVFFLLFLVICFRCSSCCDIIILHRKNAINVLDLNNDAILFFNS